MQEKAKNDNEIALRDIKLKQISFHTRHRQEKSLRQMYRRIMFHRLNICQNEGEVSMNWRFH